MTTLLVSVIPIVIMIAVLILSLKFRLKMNVKITHWLLIVYVGVLLLSLCISFFMKSEEPAEMVEEKQKTDLYEAIYSGEISKIDTPYLLDKNSFDYSGESLSITSANAEVGTTIFIERKSVDDNMIEAHIYGSFSHMNGMDFSEKIVPPRVKISEQYMSIIYPGSQVIKLALMKNVFAVNQITGDKMVNGVTIDGPIVYLRIPQSLEVKAGSELSLQEVGK
ncbi:hypothetical protein [Robertmurraya kyonggiensis]|uniref:Uncharacterized protein n=1 Tax=Robertmurraya kyonggiensis TaxID=1037680 RepID=A0A4V5P0J2_9BACI|nr:hypothetical protein [Robertmurraya kyonggiensis]TKC14870.1 hypothetical protein FA727_20400 [Robertmurraya kyonggiensis]